MEAWRGDGVRAIFKRLSQEGACLGVETREEMDAAAAGGSGQGDGERKRKGPENSGKEHNGRAPRGVSKELPA